MAGRGHRDGRPRSERDFPAPPSPTDEDEDDGNEDDDEDDTLQQSRKGLKGRHYT